MARSNGISLLCLLSVAVCLPVAAADAEARPAQKTILVEVGGMTITLNDLEQRRAPALFAARTTYYEAERRVVEDLVDEYLLEAQAKKEGVTVSQLLERHVNATLPEEPSDEALRVYYEGVETAEPYESVRDKIIESLHTRRMAKARSAYLQQLRTQSPIIIHLAPPRAPISMTNVPIRGAGNAPVTVVEFADFECPNCQQMEPVLAKLQSDFKDKIKFAYKDFPLPMHPDSQKAAEAAHCAGSQGKYWEYHDAMLANRQLDSASLKKLGADLKLDTKVFDACLDGGKMTPFVKEQAAEAQALGLPGTPSILVNGRSVNGNLTYEKIRAVIAEELSAVASEASSANRAADAGLKGGRLDP